MLRGQGVEDGGSQMSWTIGALRANKARGRVRGCGLRLQYLGMSIVLAIACGGPKSPAFAAMESIDADVTTPAAFMPHIDPSPSSIARPERRQGTPAGNPLWGVPLHVLTETRDRPLFSPSRRPPPAAIIAAPVVAPRPAPPAAPDHPLLTLVGTVVSGREAIGVFVDQESKNIVRLRIGQDHDGWTLRAVHERNAVFDDRHREAVIALPARNAKDTTANIAANAPPPAGSWTDGDGQVISPPKQLNGPATRPAVHAADASLNGDGPPTAAPILATGTAMPPLAARAAATWVDGDGQLIAPPPRRY